MAEDTRQSSNISPSDTPATDESASHRRKPRHDFPKTQAGKMWEAFGNPQDPVNELPGGTYNSAGGKPKEITWKAAFDWKINDIKNFYKAPCARDALLVGLGGGGAVGGVTAIIGGLKALPRAANLGVAGGVIFATGQHMWCESRRKDEAKGMALAIVGMKKLQEKRKREKEAEEAEVAAAKVEAERLAAEQRQKQRSIWTFW